MKTKHSGRRGILAGGNWIIDQVKLVDVFPQREQLANIRSQSQGTGGAPYNVLLNLSKLGADFPLLGAELAGKDALGELRSVLDILRQSGEAPPRSPTAGLADLPRLVAGAEATGLRVHVDVASRLPALPPGVDLAAYRIVQEALTNVTRHAHARTAAVRISADGDDLVVEVTDDGLGAGAGPSTVGGGNGIPGMRERAAALGGHLDAAPRPGGGYAVRGVLPVDRSS